MKNVLSIVPLSWLYGVMAFVAGTLRLCGWRRALVETHLERCLPDTDSARRCQIARGFYSYLGQIAAEVGHISALDQATLEERVTLENPDVVAGALREGRRVLILSSHHCNWEWLLLRCSFAFGTPLTAAYKRMKNAHVDRAVCTLREQFGGTMVPAKQIVQHLLQQRGQVKLLAMLADQSPARDNKQQLWLDFMGQPTSFHTGPGWIGAKMGFHVVLANMQRRGRGRYSVHFVELTPPGVRLEPEQMLRRYAHELELHVREFPEQYFWAYNRWKREKPLYG